MASRSIIQQPCDAERQLFTKDARFNPRRNISPIVTQHDSQFYTMHQPRRVGSDGTQDWRKDPVDAVFNNEVSASRSRKIKSFFKVKTKKVALPNIGAKELYMQSQLNKLDNASCGLDPMPSFAVCEGPDNTSMWSYVGSVKRSVRRQPIARSGKNCPQIVELPAQSNEPLSNVERLIEAVPFLRGIFRPVTALKRIVPEWDKAIIVVELGIFVWLLYEVHCLLNCIKLCITTFCAPFVGLGRVLTKFS